MYELNDKKIGEHLKALIDESGYKTTADFCRDYLKLKYSNQEITDTILQNERNRFGAILKGDKKIQTHDLPILSELLCVSCEEILSAGKQYASTRNHVTNYEIAQSHDRKVWDEYMKREDTIFLNCDEYCKTVIDYALEFKNYAFMKYLLDEGFIWFVDPNTDDCDMYGYRAGTSIKPKELAKNYPENRLPTEIRFQDRLRTQTIALAIENKDYDILESMRAREIPELQLVDASGSNYIDFNKNRNDDLIEAIAASENEEILAYFSDEFPVQDRWKRENSLMFPFLNDVIKIMLDNNNNKCAEFIIRKMIAHNKSTYEKTYSLIKEACQAEYSLIQKNKEKIIKEAYKNGVSLEELHVKFKTEEDVKRDVICCFKYDNANNVVTFFYGKDIGIATNIFFVNSRNGSPAIKKLIEELNEWYNKIISLGGEKYAEILL